MNQSSDFLSYLASRNENEQKKAAANLLSGIAPEQAAKIKNILSDEEKIKQLLSTEQAKQLMNKLKGNGNGQHK